MEPICGGPRGDMVQVKQGTLNGHEISFNPDDSRYYVHDPADPEGTDVLDTFAEYDDALIYAARRGAPAPGPSDPYEAAYAAALAEALRPTAEALRAAERRAASAACAVQAVCASEDDQNAAEVARRAIAKLPEVGPEVWAAAAAWAGFRR